MKKDDQPTSNRQKRSPQQQRFWAMLAALAFLWLCLFAIAWMSL